MIPQTLIMVSHLAHTRSLSLAMADHPLSHSQGWISFFFSGFVVATVPLPLPFPLDYFKGWLQRGLASEDIQINWVSSLSWYFLVAFFGLNAVYRVLLGDDNAADSTRDMMGPLGGGAQQQQAPQMAKTVSIAA